MAETRGSGMSGFYDGYKYGKIDYAKMKLSNQRVWDADPGRALSEALDAIQHGGFGEDCIRREVGNYEGQVMAIRHKWVDERPGGYGWVINERGKQALIDNGRDPFVILPMIDSWHNTDRHYFVRTRRYREERCLKIAKEVIPAFGNVCMDPLLNREQVKALRDYLNQWLDEEKEH